MFLRDDKLALFHNTNIDWRRVLKKNLRGSYWEGSDGASLEDNPFMFHIKIFGWCREGTPPGCSFNE
jgi:hypothetical protein